MTTQPEARISQAILKALKAQGIFAFKVHGSEYMPAGLPDILACVDGVYVGLEVKTPHKRSNTSVKQDYIHDRIRDAGGIAEVVCGVEEALKVVRRIRARRQYYGIPQKGFWK